MEQLLQKVAYIALNKPDGSLLINVPLYIKVAELQPNGMTESQGHLIDRISEIMNKRYEKQLSDYFAKRKTEKDNKP